MKMIEILLVLLMATPAAAQAPVEDVTGRQHAIQRSQQRAGTAYRGLQQAQYEARLAEQDFLNARDAHAAAQKQADVLGLEAEAARKALDAAKAKEARARKAYDDALTGVDEAWRLPPAK
jgi:hypothetical protein